MRLYGKWMYERSDVNDLIKLVENGILKLGDQGGCRVVGRFPLEQYEQAWDTAAEHAGLGENVVIVP